MTKLYSLFFSIFFLSTYFSQSQYLDQSFGIAGTVVTDGGSNRADYANAVAVGSDQSIFVGGESAYANSQKVSLLIKYNKFGVIDKSFGVNGKVFFDNIPIVSFLVDIKILENGKILLLGGANQGNSADNNVFVCRLNTNGTVDTSFGTNGFKFFNLFPGKKIPRKIIVDSTNRIIVLYETFRDNNLYYFAIHRLNSDGNVDLTFNSGTYVSSIGYDAKIAFDKISGKILVCTKFVENENALRLFRFSNDGSMDTSFNGGFSKVIDFNIVKIFPSSILITPNSEIIITGFNDDYTSISGARTFDMAKINEDGSIKTSFGVNGIKRIPVGNNLTSDAVEYGIKSILTPDNKIIFTGNLKNVNLFTAWDFNIRKTDIDGNIVTEFGNNGQVLVAFGNNASYDILHDVVLQEDGKIIAVGYAGPNETSADFAIARIENTYLSSEDLNNITKKLLKNNMTSDVLYLNQKSNCKYQIFDMSGKIVIQKKITNLSIDVSKLVKGNYVIMIDSKSERFIRK